MKIHVERKIFCMMAFAFLPLLFLILPACQDDSADTGVVEKLIGTWHQTARTVDGTAVTKDSTRLLIQVNENNICVLCDSTAAAVLTQKIVSRSGWSYSASLFNLAVDMPASWTVSFNGNDMFLQRNDFKSDGSVSKTKLTYKRVASIDF